ncbi:methyltransferase domain-containing protein [Cokeromyces recurvatus]|uniref:methyltransferase domain-containing protein n=1 Tax=Cokeromyces recurvatus TaxID=90255 RepID=UPI002220DD1B|nr:methyltransferase domain-containing protein [Cokeromyces recurvatus]KAI7899601.1 methyltransferase domain-containing protein [Cokeromyces recurvatus]
MDPLNDTLIPNQQLSLPEKYAHLTPEEYIQALIDFIEKHRRWTTSHVVDFITLNHWEILPEKWRHVLLPTNESINEDEWVDSIMKITTGSNNEQWPESLRTFIRDAQEISLPRITNINQIKSELHKRILADIQIKVERMTPVIHKIAKDQNVNSIVDLGAGQGYLSRSLAFKNHFKVLAVDSSEIQTCGAKKFDKKVIKSLGEDVLKLHHVTDFITPDNASHILSKWSSSHQDEKWLLCGLHTCGDLATMMLRLFTSSPEMTCFVDVGCCYHFLTEDLDSRKVVKDTGFPVSHYVQKTGFKLGSTAKMLSCQAPARWLNKQNETLEAYEHHFYRALLHLMMVEKGLTDISVAPIIGRLNKKKDFVSFPIYVKAALRRLNIPENTFSDEESENYYNIYKQKQVDKQIIIFWTLRVLLAPVIESLILMDRWLYLYNTIEDSPTKNVWLWPLFDPVISPRNMVLAATK